MPKKASRLAAEATCEDCNKATPEGRGVVGCWTIGNQGTTYFKHKIQHACGQFYPKCGWSEWRRLQKGEDK